MYLKKIIMQGFKSFADKTVIDFEEGVTAIVGPNGSGKSNILDALRWVMGEMSAKTLRGANMQQIIFSGTEVRKPLNFAEVTLVLDNSTRAFPTDFDELSVTRRVFRSGESGYFINNAACRLRDVQELFMDTGIGKGGYSMIGQGNVSQILSTKAEDRREFFEGAAGISKFKHRKEEAKRKLDNTTDNLNRVNDIVGELELQIGPLENQSKKAKKYLEYYEEYKGLDVSMSVITLDKNEDLLKKAKENLQSVSDEMEELRKSGDKTAQRVEELILNAKSKDEEKEEKNSALTAVENIRLNAQHDIQIAKNNILNNEKNAERIDRETEFSKKRIESINTEIADKRALIEEDRRLSEELTNGFANVSERNNEIFQEVAKKKTEIETLRAVLLDSKEKATEKKATYEGQELIRKEYLQRRDDLEAEINAKSKDKTKIEEEIKKNEEAYKELEAKRLNMQERVDELSNDLSQKKEELDSILKEESEFVVSNNSMTSKKRILEGMENDYEGFSKSVKLVLKAPELKRNSIYGTLSGLISVDKKYITAVETALAGAMQNIVVESEDDAKAAISYLKQNSGGRATFLPVSAIKSRRLDNEKDVLKELGVLSVLSDIVNCDKKYRQIVENLLGRTIVAEDIDSAIALSKKYGYKFRTVTLEGEILNAGGSMSGGSTNKQSGFLSRANEIKELSVKIADGVKALNEITAKKESVESEVKAMETRLSSYMPLLRGYENDAIIAKNNNEHLKESILSMGEGGKSLKVQAEAVEEQIKQSGEEIAKLIGETRAFERKAEETEKQISELLSHLEALETEKENAAASVMEETLKIREISARIDANTQSIDSLLSTITALNAEQASKLGEKAEFIKENEQYKEEIDLAGEKIEDAIKKAEFIKAEIAEIDKEKLAILEEQRVIQESNKEFTDKLVLLQQEYSRAETKVEKIENDTENIKSRLWEDYELTVEGAKLIKEDVEDEKAASKKVLELKGKIRALGSVNMDAIEEYKQVKERYEFLKTQKADLEEAIENLNKIISSTEELMEEHFNKQFALINESFQKVFAELFGGGKGRLYLSEPENILESGIEIEAQLPGKNLQNMSLYSGGERSMIATALLFAILAVKPTPFCVLDEIDAALDDVNVSRFATYLKNYLDDTQFVVITHRRGTMEAANILYGVTMQEKGVTKMLSLQIDEVTGDMVED
ncbi:MAG: chromosome segregation protein SMC [Clostridia bacterium]|nr:chromosome segregation protein SMC [Clostridia bacterium]